MNRAPTNRALSKRGSSSETAARFSDYLRLEREARELRREHLRGEQCKDSNTPAVRICAWEQLHGLQLPTDPSHPVLLMVANRTRLSVVQIRREQTARAALGTRQLVTQEIDLSVYTRVRGDSSQDTLGSHRAA